MNKTVMILMAAFLVFSTCTAGHNILINIEVPDDGGVAGFWLGLWHGFIVMFSFVASLFKDHIGIYEGHNNGGWYDFGFLLGVMLFFGGSQGGGKRAYSRIETKVPITTSED